MLRTAAVCLAIAGAVSAQDEVPVLRAVTASFPSFEYEFDFGSDRYGEPWTAGCSSSLLATEAGYYGPENLFDGDLATAWVEGVAGSGIGEYFSFQAPYFADYLDEELISENGIDMIGYPVMTIVLYNGFQETPWQYRASGRVRTLMIWLNDERVCSVELEDTPEPQMIELQDLWQIDPSFRGFSVNDGDTVRFEILDVYPGCKYDDTAISEILILGGQG
jgi:hypothetical protein